MAERQGKEAARFWYRVLFVVLAIWLVAWVCDVPENDTHWQTNLMESGKSSPPTVEVLQKALDSRVKHLDSRSAALVANFQFQFFLVVVSILIVMRPAEKLTIPLLGVDCPLSWLHYVIPFTLLYFWFQFGFLLDDCIKTRKDAWTILQAIEPEGLSPILSSRKLLDDSGLLDAWFVKFEPGFHDIPTPVLHDWVVTALFVSTFVLALGVAHACVLGVFFIASRRYPWARFGWIQRALPWASFLLLVLTHVMFAYGGKHPYGMQAVQFAIMLGALWGILWLYRDVERRRERGA